MGSVLSRSLCWLLLGYYGLGVLVFGGNFRLPAELRSMYLHCQATEDPDMGPLDFLTDHLINVDALFDRHPPSDEQRPHSGEGQQHLAAQAYAPLVRPAARVSDIAFRAEPLQFGELRTFYHHIALNEVFRPPCA